MAKSAFKKGQRVCCFCGKPGMSREHFWPEWAADLLPSYPATHEKGHATWNAFSKPQINKLTSRQGAPKTIKINRVCTPCNNGWMSACEERVRPWLEPMARSQAIALTPAAQHVLADYFTMKLMVSDRDIEENSVFTQEDRTAFYTDRMIPSGVVITMFQYVAEPDPYVKQYYKDRLTLVDQLRRPIGRIGNFTVRFGPLLIHLVFVRHGKSELQQNPLLGIRIFPTHDKTVRWPPIGAITMVEANELQLFLRLHGPKPYPGK